MGGAELDAEGHVLTTFRLPDAGSAERACVVGDFNDWSLSATPMQREGAGFVARIRLAPGRSYRFRYLLDGKRWENDCAADAYVPNAFGGDDCVIDLTDVIIDLTEAERATSPIRPQRGADGGQTSKRDRRRVTTKRADGG